MKVLIALDSSSASGGIINVVQARPWPSGTTFCLVSVVANTTGPFGMNDSSTSESASSATKTASHYLENAMALLKKRVPHAKVFAEVLQGGVVGRIVAKAKELHTDLIVSGHQGCYGLGGQTLGVVAQGVVQRAPCSVAVIKPKRMATVLPNCAHGT